MNNINEFIVLSILFISITLVIPFGFAVGSVPAGVPVAILFVALLCGIQVLAAQSWQRHAETGELELLALLPWLMEWTVMGKSLAVYIVIALQLAILLPVTAMWLAIPAEQWPQLWVGLMATGAVLVPFTQLAAGLMAGRRKSAALIGMMILPFAIPAVIFGVAYCNQPQLWHTHLLFLLGYAAMAWPLHALAVGANLRYGH